MEKDLRTRLLAKADYKECFNGHGEILKSANSLAGGGIIFPYTPTIQLQQQVAYAQYELVHTNFAPRAYVNTPSPTIQLTASFYQQSIEDAEYLLGVLHFLRVSKMMVFGRSTGTAIAGAPPPILELHSYGEINFKKVPVLLGGYTTTYPDDIDYIEVGENHLPSVMTLSLDLLPHYSSKKSETFSYQDYYEGKAYSEGWL